MATYKKPRLSLIERLLLILKIFRSLSYGFFTLFTGLFRGSAGAAKLTDHAKIAIIRALTHHASTRELQWLAPSLEERYAAYAKSHNFPSESITLADGTKAFWLGPPSAEKVLIYFHGGGYNLPPDPLHLSFCAFVAKPPSHSVLMLAYTLAPHATYPAQLREATALLHHLLNTLHLRASHIALGGDSAGGNLALGVLSHLLHPHPAIPPLDLGGEKLAGAALIAPWCTFATDWPSIRENAFKDVLGPVQSDKWSRAFLGGAQRDRWNQPLAVEEKEEEEADKWFEGLERVVGPILVTAGADEVLRSSVEEMVRQLRRWHGAVELVVGEDEWHNKPLLEALGGGGVQGEAVKGFVRGKL